VNRCILVIEDNANIGRLLGAPPGRHDGAIQVNSSHHNKHGSRHVHPHQLPSLVILLAVAQWLVNERRVHGALRGIRAALAGEALRPVHGGE